MALIKDTDHLLIPFKDIETATKNFTTLIGRGGYGNVYKGELLLKGKLTTVAVKRLVRNVSGQGHKEFLTEIHLLSRFAHPNLVSLLGFNNEGQEKVLIYEYAEHGSLDKLLTMDPTVCPLTCKQMIDICIDAACGLDYLHNHVAENQRVIHRDIKSANILIDHNWKAMISDLGLSKLACANENDTFIITNPCGTHGYCDPMYWDTGVLTKESDVYSFGVVLFEVLCRRLCYMDVNDERKFLNRLARHNYEKGKLDEIIDPVMKKHLPPGSLNRISKIAYQCLLDDREKRPSMGLVIKELKEALEVLEMNIQYPQHFSGLCNQEEEVGVLGLNDDFNHGANELPQKSSSAVWPILESPTTPSPKQALVRSFSTLLHNQEHLQQRKKLTFSYSYKEDEMNIVGFNVQYPKQLSSFCYQEEELGVFGLDEDIRSLVRRLTYQTEMFTEMFVPIVGEEGSGKTTLARAVYKNRKIKDHFEFHDWISVTEEHTTERILPAVLKTTSTVKGRRYLIVIDGVGSYGVFQALKDAFPNEENGSKVIFTSRRIPEMMKLNPHIMSILNENESWKMFLNKARREKKADSIPSRLKSKILSICNGSPQKIVLMAGLLSNNRIRGWSLVMDGGQCPNDVLRICYNDLHIHLKLCMLYLALFPIDYDIPVRRLLRLWLAERFVKRGAKHQFPEELVQKCFDELVGRNMIQITKLRSDNSPRRCRLVPCFRDYLLPKAQDISLFYIHRNSEYFEDAEGPFGVRRLVQYTSNTGLVARQQTRGQGRVDPSLLRSYLSFNFQPKDMSEKQVGTVLGRVIRSNYALLSVLDLEGVCQTTLPDKLGHLCHLRYLGLRWTFLESLPESVGDLSYLETLDVKHTRVDTLPDCIWRLKRLRHLNLNNIRLSMPPKSSSSLVTLWGLVLDEKLSINEGLGKLLNLRELGIKFNLSKSQSILLDWIVKLVNLQSLRLTSVNDMGQPSNLVLKPLTSLKNLSHLNLYGQLEKLPTVDEFPPTVKVLTLSLYKLDKDPMETLEQLPCLIVLRLLGESFTGTRLVCRRGGFKKLEVLKLWVLKNLEGWDVEEDAMVMLKEVEIRSCHKLSNIPCRILQKQRCLEELILTDMHDDFVAGTKKRKSKYTSLTIK